MAHKNRWTVIACHKSDSFIIAFSYKNEHSVSRRYKKSAGRGATKREAEAKARALCLEMQKDPTAFVERFVTQAPKVHALPFADVAATFLADHVSGLRPSTQRTHERVLRVHLVPAFGGDLRDVTRSAIDTYIAKKRREGLSPKSIANHVSVLSSVFDFANRREWFDKNPAKGAELPKVADQDFDWLTAEAADRFLAAVRELDPKYADSPRRQFDSRRPQAVASPAGARRGCGVPTGCRRAGRCSAPLRHPPERSNKFCFYLTSFPISLRENSARAPNAD